MTIIEVHIPLNYISRLSLVTDLKRKKKYVENLVPIVYWHRFLDALLQNVVLVFYHYFERLLTCFLVISLTLVGLRIGCHGGRVSHCHQVHELIMDRSLRAGWVRASIQQIFHFSSKSHQSHSLHKPPRIGSVKQ